MRVRDRIINRKKWIYIITTTILIVGATVLVIPLQREYQERIDTLQENLVERLESFIGFRVEYGSVSPSLLRYIEVRDLRIFGGGLMNMSCSI